jgi:hypothetical protein
MPLFYLLVKIPLFYLLDRMPLFYLLDRMPLFYLLIRMPLLFYWTGCHFFIYWTGCHSFIYWLGCHSYLLLYWLGCHSFIYWTGCHYLSIGQDALYLFIDLDAILPIFCSSFPFSCPFILFCSCISAEPARSPTHLFSNHPIYSVIFTFSHQFSSFAHPFNSAHLLTYYLRFFIF